MPHEEKNIAARRDAVPGARRCAFALIFVFAIPVFLTGCDDSPKAPVTQRSVKSLIVSAARSEPSLTWTGTIEPAEYVTLQFRTDGILATKPVEIGTSVKKDQVVATLTGSQSKGDTTAVLAEFQDADAAVQKGRQELERTKKLYAIGTVSRAQLEEATATLATLEAKKIRARAEKDRALNHSDFNVLKAPFDGVVTSYIPYVGQVIASGQEIIKIASARAEVQFSLSSMVASGLKPGDRISIKYGNQSIEGQIRFINPQLDRGTLTSQVRASLITQIANPIFGSPVSVELRTFSAPLIALPATALTRSGSQPAVFVIDQNGKLASRPVTVARFSAEKVFISSGLKTGERVVIAGINTLESGEKVTFSTEAGK